MAFDETMPKWLQRETPGTNIIVFGFKQFSRWSEILIASVATNFFAVINKGLLSVQIQDLNTKTHFQKFLNVQISPNLLKLRVTFQGAILSVLEVIIKPSQNPTLRKRVKLQTSGFSNFSSKKDKMANKILDCCAMICSSPALFPG